MLALPFNQSLSDTSAEEFIRRYLVGGLSAKYISIGDDFKFGKGRKGDYQMLHDAGKNYGFEVGRFETINVDQFRVSSSRVRACLGEGELEQVENLLGRKYAMVGRVVHGDKRGREWGFPTANIAINRKIPMTGVFAVTVRGLDNDVVKGVANLGKRPTVDGLKTLLEIHLFDFTENIYGKRICVEFVEKIRDEKRFESFDALKDQIFQDCELARQILSVDS